MPQLKTQEILLSYLIQKDPKPNQYVCSGGSKGSARDAPPGSKFFQFHAVFWEMLAKLYVGPPPEGLAPPPQENPASAPGMSKKLCRISVIFYFLIKLMG